MADAGRAPGSRRPGGSKRSSRILVTVVVAFLLVPAPPAQAGLVRGILSIIGGVLEIPRSTLAGTFGGPPIVGTLVGAVNGTLRGVGMVTGGAFETVFSAVALAKKLAPLVPFFL